MKKALFILLMILSQHAVAQPTIDLKTLIGTRQGIALHHLVTWGIKVSPSTEYDNLWVGYDEGIQLEAEDSIITTIWIEFTDRRTGAFPFQVDNVIKPLTDINNVILAYGKPDETGDGFKIGNSELNGWVKWNSDTWQLHCEIDNSKVVMITLMQPDWVPGK